MEKEAKEEREQEEKEKQKGREKQETEKKDKENEKLTSAAEGPVTDYGATFVHWMRHRRPRYKGSFAGETERPSNSYIVDVSP